VYTEGAWTFRLDERRYQPMVEFKFVLAPGTWMVGENLKRAPAEGYDNLYACDKLGVPELPGRQPHPGPDRPGPAARTTPHRHA
jgi:hypothetical protein